MSSEDWRAGLSDDRLREMWYLLRLCRYFDERMEALYRQGRLPGAICSGRGQEGTHCGVAFALRPDDSLFCTHRDLSAQLTKGLELNRVMAQFWGRIDGYTRGRDGNSHIGDWRGGAARRDGDLRRRRHLERPLARGAQHVGDPRPTGGVGREQQPVGVFDAELAGDLGADDRGTCRRLRDPGG